MYKNKYIIFSLIKNKNKEVIYYKIMIDGNNNKKIKEKEIIKVNYEKIKNNNYLLFINKYNIEELDKIEGLTYKKLNEICNLLYGYSFKLLDYNNNEKYNIITILFQL
jgi:hypothetical protein